MKKNVSIWGFLQCHFWYSLLHRKSLVKNQFKTKSNVYWDNLNHTNTLTYTHIILDGLECTSNKAFSKIIWTSYLVPRNCVCVYILFTLTNWIEISIRTLRMHTNEPACNVFYWNEFFLLLNLLVCVGVAKSLYIILSTSVCKFFMFQFI